jgi:hypothetical protein
MTSSVVTQLLRSDAMRRMGAKHHITHVRCAAVHAAHVDAVEAREECCTRLRSIARPMRSVDAPDARHRRARVDGPA